MARSSNPLDIRTVIGQVTTALIDVLDLAYKVRAPEAADLAALQAYALTPNLDDRALVYVASEGVVYRWLAASTLPAAPPFIVAPLASLLPETGNGRFVRTTSSVTLGPAYFRPLHRVRSGYARAVELYVGDDQILERIYGQRPAFLVEWVSDDLSVKSYAHGALYDYDLRFSVHCLARNLRNNNEALLGSDVPGDAAAEGPGLFQMIGDLRYLLGGCTLGLDPGVKFVDVTGEARIVETLYGDRVYRAELDVLVKASVHVVDEDLFPSPEVWVERHDAGTPAGAPFDASNYVAQGLAVSPSPSLTATVAAGVAFLSGQIVSAPAVTRLFEPDADTYRDLKPDGSLSFYAVEPGGEAPAQRTGTLRIGVTRTEGSRVVADRFLCSFSVPSGADPGDPFRAAP
ncbi:MAG: phage protein Gp37 [Polyangia bacterium]